MGIKAHYSRDREAMRLAILAAARRLFVREGYANVSIRKIAASIGYSPAAIYLYYPGKAEIFLALAEEGFGRLAQVLAENARETEDLQLALEQRFWRYYEFSKKQPEYFWLMFVDRSVPEWGSGAGAALLQQFREDGVELVRRCVAAGLLPSGTNAAAAFHVLVSAIHGAAVHRLCGRLVQRREADILARDTLRAAIAGLRAGVPLELQRGAVKPPAAPRTRESLP